MGPDSVKDETIVEYLNMLQNVINRLAQNSFLIKGWFTTIFAAVIIITYTYVDKLLIYPILFAISLIFWGLDSYYLRLEKLFRRLYSHVVVKFNENKKLEIILFDMDITPFKKKEKILRILFSFSEFFYYIIFIIIVILLFCFDIFNIL